jgi:D-alanyl-D-alanine carboxypeptidase (penicillin-binding protein 5/6)
MTAYTVLRCCDILKINLQEPIIVSEEAAEVTGTSAMLLPGDKLTIEQLLYGLMLPSGNDAAFVLAFYFGSLLEQIVTAKDD